ncbi:MAG: adenosine nucleotide hydrolase [Gemmatimonadota bacterium]|nr:MAG: adenosine nucleotide hydrolase [Gemmatimonadota bacterium]
MTYALMSSGGKDSTLALDRARREDLDVRYFVNIYDGTTQRVRFHGVRRDLIELQAHALGLEPIMKEASENGFEAAFANVLQELKQRDVAGIVFGNVSLSDVRGWYEERVLAAGLQHLEPLWGEPSIELAWEVVERGYQALIVSVDLTKGAAEFLQREFDADLVTDLGCSDDLDPGGEQGEYHTFTYDGPEFANAIPFVLGETVEKKGHRFIDLEPVSDQ